MLAVPSLATLCGPWVKEVTDTLRRKELGRVVKSSQ